MKHLDGMMFWTDAYLADTGHLTTFQHGVYMLLLIALWRSKDGYLKNDETVLARSCRTTLDKWRKVTEVIMPLLTIEGDRVFQKRVMKERGKAAEKVKNLTREPKAGIPARNPSKPAKPLETLEPTFALGGQTKTQNRSKNRGVVRQARTPIPHDWRLDESKINFAIEHGFFGIRIDEIAMAFVAHHLSRGTLSCEWNMEWCSWLLRERKFDRDKQKRPSFMDVAMGRA